MRTPHRPRLFAVGLALTCACLLLLNAAPAQAQDRLDLPDNHLDNPDRWLSDAQWSELRYGLSIREPIQATRVPDTPQGDVIRWALPQGTRIRLAFARGEYEGLTPNGTAVRVPAQVNLMKMQIDDEMRAAASGVVINTNSNQVVEVNGMVGVINYFTINPDAPDAEPYLFGYALLQLDDQSIAVLRMECPPDQMLPAVSTFECMVHSIQVESARDVNRQLHEWLTNGENLMNNLTQEDRLAAMRPDRLFRILEDGEDLGYLRIWQRYQDRDYYNQLQQRLAEQDPSAQLEGVDAMRITGNAVFIQAHYEAQGTLIDRQYQAIDAEEGVEECWVLKNTLTYENDPNNRRAGAWVETGIRGFARIEGRNLDRIQVNREGSPPRHMVEYLLQRESNPDTALQYPSAVPGSYPSGEIIDLAWPTPQRAFLSYFDAQLVPAMLPSEAQTYCFTVYDPQASRIDIRYMRVEPRADGGKTVYVRPVLDQAERVLVFDRNSNLVSQAYPDGRELRQTTRQELARIWGVRLRD